MTKEFLVKKCENKIISKVMIYFYSNQRTPGLALKKKRKTKKI